VLFRLLLNVLWLRRVGVFCWSYIWYSLLSPSSLGESVQDFRCLNVLDFYIIYVIVVAFFDRQPKGVTKMHTKIVNGFSITRIPLGVLALLLACNGLWPQALAVLLTGLATDWMDGYLAKRWNCGTDFGAEVLEPICDLALTMGAGLGLLITGVVGWLALAPLITLAIWGHLAANFGGGLLKKIGTGFMPLYFLAVILTTAVIYGVKANVPAWGFILALAIGSLMANAKRNRLSAWLRGNAA